MEEGSLCKRRKTWEEEIYWKHFSSMYFFLFLPHDFHNHLVLPAKFVENMMTMLPDKVSLIGPSGTKWDVELKKTDKVEFCGDGWKQFLRDYDLKENNLLLFKYNQSSAIEVLIFDPDSFCEKEESYFVKQCKATIESGKKRNVAEAFIMGVAGDEENDNVHNDTEIVLKKKSLNDVCEVPERRKNPTRTARKGLPACATRRGRGRPKRFGRPCQSRNKLKAQPEKEARGNGQLHDGAEQEPEENGAMHVSEREQDTLEHRGGNGLGTTHSPKSTAKKDRPRNQTPTKSVRKRGVQTDTAEKYAQEYISNRRVVTEIEKDDTLKRALKDYTDEKSFVSVMRPTAVYRRFFMTVPAEWKFRDLFCHNQPVVLRIGEKTWTTFYYHNGKNGGGLAGLGWKKFAVDNFLEEFDVCIFHLASEKLDNLLVMDVQIFRVIPEAVPPSPTTRSTPK